MLTLRSIVVLVVLSSLALTARADLRVPVFDDGSPLGWNVLHGDWSFANGTAEVTAPPTSPCSCAWDEPTAYANLTPHGSDYVASLNVTFLRAPGTPWFGAHGGVLLGTTQAQRATLTGLDLDWIEGYHSYRLSTFHDGSATTIASTACPSPTIGAATSWIVDSTNGTLTWSVDGCVLFTIPAPDVQTFGFFTAATGERVKLDHVEFQAGVVSTAEKLTGIGVPGAGP